MMCLLNPLTIATTILVGFSRVLGLEGVPELTTAGILTDRRNVPDGDPIIVPNVVLVVVSRLSWPRQCIKRRNQIWWEWEWLEREWEWQWD
jgi:hypothetical protein